MASAPEIQEVDAEPSAGKGWSWPLRIAAGFAGLIALLLLIAAALVLGINTSPGRDFVKDQVEALEFENGLSIGIGAIDGSLYDEMTIRDLTLSDPQGVFLRVPAANVDWNPFAFTRSHIDISALTAETATLERLPEFTETPPSDDPLLPDYDIDVGRFEIEKFFIKAPVTGQTRVASMSGDVQIADARAKVNFEGSALANMVAGQDDAGGDKVVLRLDAVPDDNVFDLELDLNAPASGIISGLAGFDEALTAQLSGKGSWENWNGQLAATLGEDSLADLELSGRDGTFGADGAVSLGKFAPPAATSLLSDTTAIDVSAILDERSAQIDGRFSSPAFTLGTNGLIDLSDNNFDNFKAAFVLLKPSALTPNLRGEGLRAMLTLNGEIAAPLVNYDINAARIAVNDIDLIGLRARGETRVDREGMSIPVSATVARISGLDTAAGGALSDITLRGDIAYQDGRLLSDNLRIRSDRIDAGVTLVADLNAGRYGAAIDGKLGNYLLESVGIFNLETDVDLKADSDGDYRLAGKARARSTSLSNESVSEFLGGDFIIASDIAYASDGIARFSNARLDAPLLKVTGGRGTYSLDGQFDVAASAVSDAYGPLGLQLAGTITNPRAIIKAANPGLGVGLASVTAVIRGDNGNYRVDADGQSDYGPFTADVTVAAGSGPLALNINRADIAGIGLTGRMQQTSAGPFTGQLTANGQGLNGTVQLGARGQYQTADIKMRARGTVLPGPARVRIGSAIIDANVVLYDQPEVVADVQLANTDYGALNINAMRAKVDYRGGKGSAKLLAEGRSGVPFRISANADLQSELWRAAMQGKVRGIAFKTDSPARIIPRVNAYELLPTKVSFGKGSMRLAGEFGSGMKVQSRLDALDMSIVNAFMPGMGIGGTATGSLDFVQASENAFPKADARLKIRNFTRTTAVSVSQAVNVNFVGQLQASGGAGRAVVRRGGAVIGRMNAGLTPLAPGNGPWMKRLMQAPLNGGIRYNGPADTLFSLAGQDNQSLSGVMGIAADFSGSLANPQLAGIVRANKLTYENLVYGTRLSNMTVQGKFEGNELQLERLEAAAGKGSVKASGSISLAADQGFPMNVKVTLDKARLARSDALAATATGTLTFSKLQGQTALLAGRILLPETRYKVVQQGAAELPNLTGVRFKPPAKSARITGNETAIAAAGMFDQIRLDLELVAPEKLYVSGMGLESEWSADIKINGTSAAPRMAGSVELIRGTLGFAGRSFALVDGRLGFTGGRTLDPTILLSAREDIEDVAVTVNVSGQAFSPQIAFTSSPGLPQDEIISRILFGSSVGNLSAIQTVQLAASLNSLRSTGGGLNPLGKLRSATGIDRLRIVGSDQSTGRGTALAAGQYITDDVYIEVITDARGFTATQLEISLTPALSVLSQAGGAIGTNVNVRYRKDY